MRSLVFCLVLVGCAPTYPSACVLPDDGGVRCTEFVAPTRFAEQQFAQEMERLCARSTQPRLSTCPPGGVPGACVGGTIGNGIARQRYYGRTEREAREDCAMRGVWVPADGG